MRAGFGLLIIFAAGAVLILGFLYYFFTTYKVKEFFVTLNSSPAPSTVQFVTPYARATTDFPIPQANWSYPIKSKFKVYVQCEHNYQEIDGYSQSVIFETGSQLWGREIGKIPPEDELEKLGWFEEGNDALGGHGGDVRGFAKMTDCKKDKIGKHLLLFQEDLNAQGDVEKILVTPKWQITIHFN